jgi:hypothetical protein
LRNAQIIITNNLRKSKVSCAPQIPQIDFIHCQPYVRQPLKKEFYKRIKVSSLQKIKYVLFTVIVLHLP